ncbi:MAG TPA: DUF4157 domain-containing protein [Pyrinomonadaceae bacterium]
MQAKLAISTPGDQYEQEADRVADQVVSMATPPEPHRAGFTKAPGSVVQRKCTACEENEELVQKKKSEGKPAAADQSRDAHQMVREALRSPGQRLDSETRAFMEPRFGHDFSDVRVHIDAKADESARSVNAQAYTVCQDVVFESGRYSPQSEGGRKLLAHELAHTLQQSGRSPSESFLQRQPGGGKDVPVNPPAPKPTPAATCPTFVSLTATINTPKISDSCKGQKCRMELGCCTTPRGTCASTKDSGAAFKGTIDVPAGCTGELAFAQNLVSTDRKRTQNKTNECVALTSPSADGGVPWKGCEISVTTAGSHTVESDDCPFMLLDNLTAASAKDSFKTFLMWKASGGKMWKTIGMVSWTWSASTTQKKGTDCASEWTAPSGSPSTATGAMSTELPVTEPSAQDLINNWKPCEKKK